MAILGNLGHYRGQQPEWLATSGAPEIVLWSFTGRDGPRGKEAQTVGLRAALVTVVACHPKLDVVAAGFSDGALTLVPYASDAALSLRDPDGDALTALTFDETGERLAFGTEGGKLGLTAVGL